MKFTSSLPHQAFDFKQFKLSQVIPALNDGIAQARSVFTSIVQRPVEQSTFENTIVALETAFEETDYVSEVFFNLLSAHSDTVMQKMAPEISTLLSALGSDLILNDEIFKRVNYVFEHRPTSLTTEDLKLLNETHSEFVRNGALLTTEKKARLRKLDEDLSRLGPEFQENVLKSTNVFQLHIEDSEDVRGVPAHALEQAKQTAQQKGYASGYVFTLQAPSYQAIMQFCENRDVRRKMYMAQMTRSVGGEFDNRGVLRRTIELRAERAQLLGYADHAEFVLQKRMAENSQCVFEFLNRLLQVVQPVAQKELRDIEVEARKIAGIQKLEPWDVIYFSEKMKKEKFALDPEELRPYFPLETVLSGLFEHAQRLYGLRFRECADYPTYHKDVRVFEVTDEHQKFIGLFYIDLFPRDSKQGGGWMTTYLSQGLFRGELRRPHVSIVCNFPEPIGPEPSLLPLREVRTLFHEFGHSLHALLSQVKYRSLSGTHVMWDFVELPSQIMENWVQKEEGLALIARHYKTGESLPRSFIDKIKNSAKFHAGLAALRQISFAWLDMAFHTTDPKSWTDVIQFEIESTQHITLLPQVPGTCAATAFAHIFGGGYSAGYYSYKWAEVLEADAFEYFEQKGLFNPEVAKKFRDDILSRGGTEHPRELYRRFRGRDADPNALFRREGLLS